MLVASGVALVVVVVALATVWIVRWRRTPAELRGDWWSVFEAEFRDYARAGAPRQSRKHRANDGSGGG